MKGQGVDFFRGFARFDEVPEGKQGADKLGNCGERPGDWVGKVDDFKCRIGAEDGANPYDAEETGADQRNKGRGE